MNDSEDSNACSWQVFTRRGRVTSPSLFPSATAPFRTRGEKGLGNEGVWGRRRLPDDPISREAAIAHSGERNGSAVPNVTSTVAMENP